MIKVGLVGFGLAAQAFHAPLIRAVPGLQLACVLERSGNRAREKYPDVRIARSLDELLSDAEIGLCVIATPNNSHFELAQTCLLAGRDVLIDKPMSPSWKECTGLTALAKEKKRLLTVYQNRRCDGDFRSIQNLLSSGALGAVTDYEARYDRYRPQPKPGAWRENADVPGSGVLFDLGAHLIDQALVLFGEPQAVTAKAFCQRETSQINDAFDVCLDYGRMHAALKARILTLAPGPHFVVHGTRGSFVKYGMDPQEERLRAGDFPQGTDWGKDWGLDAEKNWGTLTTVGEPAKSIVTERGDYRDFYRNLRDAIEGRAPLAVTPEQALRTMKAIFLARTSSNEGRTVPWTEAPA